MDTTTVHHQSRELRGLTLWREHADAIRFDATERVWLVPSTSDGGTSVYEVALSPESCECRDFEFRGSGCKHFAAATIARAKTAPCSGCGERFARRDTVEVGPEHVARGHEVLEGERFCRPCGRRRGVL